jgi:ectoine hydroxylase-related dioxygenase (phytanoyl-CoA dioxygenase family)
MTEDEKYLFDLNGYLVVKGALNADEVAACNTAIDHYSDRIKDQSGPSTAGGSKTLSGARPTSYLDGVMALDRPWRDAFRSLLTHANVIPHLTEILGPGFRLDHNASVLLMRKGAEGLTLHGSSGPGFDPTQYYIFRDGQMHNGLTVVAWQFADVGPGDGGLCVIPGSHKSNLPCPPKMRLCDEHAEFVKQVVCKAGDVVIFTEALTHGTIPWSSDGERRSLLLRYAPGNLAYAKNYYPAWPDDVLEGLTDEQRGVFEPPYHTRLDRPAIDS